MNTETEAARLLENPPEQAKKKRGRPRLPRDENGNIIRDGSIPSAKKQANSSGGEEESAPKEKFEYHKEESNVAATAFLMRTVWGMLGPFIKCGPLNDEQAQQLGEAADPVFQKYLPVLADWQIEINFVMAVYAVFEATRIRDSEATSDSSAEVVDED